MAEPLDLKFTPEARARVMAFLESIPEYAPTLCLMKGRVNDEPEERWGFGAYADSNLEAMTLELNRLGHPLLYSVEGLIVAIPQFHLLPELVGKTLALGSKGLTLIDREPGA